MESMFLIQIRFKAMEQWNKRPRRDHIQRFHFFLAHECRITPVVSHGETGPMLALGSGRRNDLDSEGGRGAQKWFLNKNRQPVCIEGTPFCSHLGKKTTRGSWNVKRTCFSIGAGQSEASFAGAGGRKRSLARCARTLAMHLGRTAGPMD